MTFHALQGERTDLDTTKSRNIGLQAISNIRTASWLHWAGYELLFQHWSLRRKRLAKITMIGLAKKANLDHWIQEAVLFLLFGLNTVAQMGDYPPQSSSGGRGWWDKSG